MKRSYFSVRSSLDVYKRQDKGTLNAILAVVGIKKISWLYKMPMFAIIVGNIWRGTAYSMMVYQAALDNVSGDVKEAAQIDGAGKFQTILYVVVPLIKNKMCIRDRYTAGSSMWTSDSVKNFAAVIIWIPVA